MAFTRSELAAGPYNGVTTGGFQQYFYRNSAADNVTGANFFLPAQAQLVVGNTIYVANTGITYRVTVSNSTTLTIVANYAAPA